MAPKTKTVGNRMRLSLPNIMRAIETSKTGGLKTVAFIGKSGGKAKGHCDFEFMVPSQTTARVQEAHLMLYHSLCQWIDWRLVACATTTSTSRRCARRRALR